MQEVLTIERLSDDGSGVAHAQDGVVVFVEAALPGDVVCASVKAEKSSFRRAHILEIVEPSPQRIAPACPYANECGGCSWQHITYETQTQTKQQLVCEALTHIAGLSPERAAVAVRPTLPSAQQFAYRNKLELNAQITDSGKLQVGFYNEGTHSIVTPEQCLLAPKAIGASAKALRGALSFAHNTNDAEVYRIGIRHSTRTHQTEVALWTEAGSFKRSRVAAIVADALATTCIVRVIAPRGKARSTQKVEVLTGNGSWKEHLAGFDFLTSAPSFFQVNTAQAETLVREALACLPLTSSSSCADLYSGGGTFTLPLAACGASILAIESVGSSVRDLQRNLHNNALDTAVTVVGGDVERELPVLASHGTAFASLDAMLVDPPRCGLRAPVIDAIAATAPKRLVYVSCNPATWARDVTRLAKSGYSLEHAQPVDLFPQTHHIELVSLFTLSQR